MRSMRSIRVSSILAALLVLPPSTAWAQTPVTGPSVLEHLHRDMGNTSMGRSSSVLGPPPTEVPARIQVGPLPPAMVLAGSDLYRLKCRGCHGPAGEGAPPEINSIINPVRATSAATIMKRMRERGASMSHRDAAVLAKQSASSLSDRLHNGGTEMPTPGLAEKEIGVLLPYLDQLAGLPAKQLTMRESTSRVGENLVKSTCHICHAAVGPNPTPEQIAAGVIPPLSTLTSRTSLEQFVAKVTKGASLPMGALAIPSRGRMPVFSYVSENEAAAAYVYLLAYPPQAEEPPAAPATGQKKTR